MECEDELSMASACGNHAASLSLGDDEKKRERRPGLRTTRHSMPGRPSCFEFVAEGLGNMEGSDGEQPARKKTSRWKAPEQSGRKKRAIGCVAGAVLLLVLAAGAPLGVSSQGAADLDIPRHVSADDPTLQRAVDAYRQARQLDKSLKGSEEAVEAQTRELEGQLRASRAQAAVVHDAGFNKEVSLDQQLLRQAEKEARRDKRLVREAEGEMRGDKTFLEHAYNQEERQGPGPAGGGAECPPQQCRQVREEGLSPAACTEGLDLDCPRINCYDYQAPPTPPRLSSPSFPTSTHTHLPLSHAQRERERERDRHTHTHTHQHTKTVFTQVPARSAVFPLLPCSSLGAPCSRLLARSCGAVLAPACRRPPPLALTCSGCARACTQEGGGCAQGRVCVRPRAPTPGCEAGSGSGLSWTRSKCPGMLCERAGRNGFSPQFCALTHPSQPCPQLACFRYANLGGCQGPEEQGFSAGAVCGKEAEAEAEADCQGARGASGESMRGVSPLHDPHASKSVWSRPRNVEDRMALLLLLLLLSVAAAGAYVLFRRHMGAQGRQKRPAPVPAYYGRL